MALIAHFLGALARGGCDCPLCSEAEWAARLGAGMAPRHPERLARPLPASQEGQFAAISAELWPDGFWPDQWQPGEDDPDA